MGLRRRRTRGGATARPRPTPRPIASGRLLARTLGSVALLAPLWRRPVPVRAAWRPMQRAPPPRPTRRHAQRTEPPVAGTSLDLELVAMKLHSPGGCPCTCPPAPPWQELTSLRPQRPAAAESARCRRETTCTKLWHRLRRVPVQLAAQPARAPGRCACLSRRGAALRPRLRSRLPPKVLQSQYCGILPFCVVLRPARPREPSPGHGGNASLSGARVARRSAQDEVRAQNRGESKLVLCQLR